MNLRKNAGFSLIDALVAFLLLSLGLVTLAKFQGYLIQNSALSKQQSEAVVLGEQKLEDFRSYEVLTTSSGKLAYADIVNGSDTVTGESAVFTRTWTVTTNTSPAYKNITITVSWVSQGATRTVTLQTIVASSDPAISGQLVSTNTSVPPPNPRNVDIPPEAVDTGMGTSVYTPPGTTTTLTYDNVTGDIIQIDDQTARSVSGSIVLGTGNKKPSAKLSELSVTASNDTGSSFCSYDGNGAYICTVSQGWGGTIIVNNPESDITCKNFVQPITNVQSNLTGKDFQIIKSTQTCSAPYDV